jgi:uncharacterized membrane protein YqhA
MFEQLLKIRYITVVIVVLAVLHALAFMALGAKIAFKGYVDVLHPSVGEHAVRPGIELLHALDFLFVSMVLIVLALGIAKLFLLNPNKEISALPSWLEIDSITELKVLLWETILTTLVIVALSDLSEGLIGSLSWPVLLTPISILLLSLSLYFMKKA